MTIINSIKSMLRDKKFYLFLGMSVVFFGILFAFEYATDTYIVALDVKGYAKIPMSSGRPLAALFFYVFGLMSNSVYPLYYFSLVMSMIFLAIAVYRVFLLLARKLPVKTSFLFAFFLIVNPFFLEYFLFIETCLFTLDILLMVLAIEQFNHVLNKKYIRIIPILIFGIIVSGLYQSMLSLFAVGALFLISMKVKKIKPFIGYSLLVIGLYVVSLIPDFIFIKVFSSSSRVGGLDFGNIVALLTSGGLGVFFLGLAVTLIGIALLAFFKNKYRNDGRPYWVHLLVYLYLYFGSICFTIGYFVLVSREDAVPSYRTMYPLIALIVMSVFEFALDQKGNQENHVKKWQITTLLACLVAEFGLFQTVYAGRLINNYADKNEILAIGNAINEKEAATGVKITKMSFYKDGDSHISHKGAFCYGVNIKIFMTAVEIESVNLFLHGNYVKVNNDQTIYDTYFKNYRSEDFDISKQLVFVDDTLHVYVY